jgi:hypothetical protein
MLCTQSKRRLLSTACRSPHASSVADIPTMDLRAAKADAPAMSRRGVFKLPAILRLENGPKVALGGTKVPACSVSPFASCNSCSLKPIWPNPVRPCATRLIQFNTRGGCCRSGLSTAGIFGARILDVKCVCVPRSAAAYGSSSLPVMIDPHDRSTFASSKRLHGIHDTRDNNT